MAAKSSDTLIPTHPTAQRLLEAAMRSMDTDGEAGLRVDAVVAEAGVTIPVLYHHFGNREGLVRAAHVARLQRDLDTRIAEFAAVMAHVDGPESLITTFDNILAAVASVSDERFVRVNVLGATYGRPDLQAEVAVMQRRAWERVAEHLVEPQRRGWVRADVDLVEFVGWLFGMFVGRVLVDIQGPSMSPAAWDDYTRTALYTVLLGEVPPRPAAG
jgi:AcrR family transcriptional regulator